jgi:hypothetical protein
MIPDLKAVRILKGPVLKNSIRAALEGKPSTGPSEGRGPRKGTQVFRMKDETPHTPRRATVDQTQGMQYMDVRICFNILNPLDKSQNKDTDYSCQIHYLQIKDPTNN